ncbi:hypothetical protein MC77_015630 [Citrobacter koseri]|nr:hypothetical protein MC77_015630 [Citrobacter koseri]
MAAQAPYPAYGMVLSVGLISAAPSGKGAGWRHSALSGLRYGAAGRPDKRSAIRQKCRMAAQVPYPAYGYGAVGRPDKRSAIRQKRRICALRCRVGINLVYRFDLRQHLFA